MRAILVALALSLGVVPARAAKTTDVSQTGRATSLGAGIGLERTLGVGIYLGEPSGVSVKYWLSPELALHGVLGAWLHPHDGAVLAADLLYHVRDLAPNVQAIELGLYLGAGFGAGFWSAEQYHRHDDPWPHWHQHEIAQALVYLRPIVGGGIWFRSVPLELNLELAPSLRLMPDGAGLEWGGGLAVRYVF
jgi:hypothetical protein